MTITIFPLSDEPGLLVEDLIEQRQCRILTGQGVDPQSIATDRFAYPLDTAVSFRASEVTIPEMPATYLRDSDGNIVSQVDHFMERHLPEGEYVIEVSSSIKLYLSIAGPMTVSTDAIRITVTFDDPQEVLLGARSYHERPAATVTTTPAPEDVMTAVSHLGSSLKTTSPERSYPTLRGHPPELQLGSSLSVPDVLDRPETGIEIVVPPELGAVFVVAPLAFYTGATVVPGHPPRISTGHGFEHVFDVEPAFETAVGHALKQTFFLDCLVRAEGRYDIPLHERRVLDTSLGLDWGALYAASPAERLESYLAVPFETIAEYVPRWKLTAYVDPRPENIEILPFLVDDLAVVRTPNADPATGQAEQAEAIEAFTRDGSVRRSRGGGGHDERPSFTSRVAPEETDSLEQAWVGEDVPVGASKAMIEAFRNRLRRDEKEGNIDIVVVCNDPEMADEQHTASDVYGSREELPFDVRLYDDLTVDRLRFVMETDIDFFHYIGHIDDDGFECEDGMLDVATLDSVGIDAFFLNACRSYQQGAELIRKGAVGGVVTLDDIINSGAIRVGKAMARLLNNGFPLRAALNIASDWSIIGSQYIVIGDGNVDIAHSEGLVPNLLEITREEDGYRLRGQTYHTGHMGVGSTARPNFPGNEEHYLLGSRLMQFSVDRDTLQEYLELEMIPVKIDQQITWSDEVRLDD